MRIRTQFIITTLLFGIILILMAVSAFVTHRQVDTTKKQESIATSIAQGANDLSYLANDYLIYRESQQLSRWQSRFALFSNQVAALNVDRPEQQVLTRNIQVNLHRLKEVFNSTVSAAGALPSTQEAVLDPALLQVSWSRIAIQSQGLISDASRLSQLLHQQMDQLVNRRTLLLYFMMAVFGALLLSSYMMTSRRILKSLARLRAGAAIIGSGNLDFSIEEKRNDEIGDLSHAFNQMTADLKTVTASKADLEHEIAERKQAEEALRRSEEHFRALAEALPQIVWTADAEGAIEWFNNRWYDYTGEHHGISEGWSWDLVAHPDDMPHTLKNWQEARQRGTLFQNEIRVRSHAGQYRWFLVRAWPLQDEEGKVVRWFGTNTDIEELRQVEQQLRESEARYRTLFEAMTEGFAVHEIICDEQGRPCDYRFLDVNPAFERLTGLKRADLLNRCVRDVLPDTEAHWIENYGRVALSGEPVHFENFSAPLGRWYEVFAYRPMLNQFAVLFADITERKRTEDALREREARISASLREKEVLLKEIHHRVKNNMQVISSLVALQAEELQDAATRAVLMDLTHRVRSMAMVHEKLYQSVDLARVEFAGYARSLLNYLWRAHGTAASGVRLAMDLEPVSLAVNEAVPCGLILNELVSNALKHAFCGGAGGEVAVSLCCDEESRIVLRVRDNGAGLPPGFDWRQARSLGLRLVQMLAGQLHAAVDVSAAGGTEFAIRFGGHKA
jgi:PAS domain S-box-containing protein